MSKALFNPNGLAHRSNSAFIIGLFRPTFRASSVNRLQLNVSTFSRKPRAATILQPETARRLGRWGPFRLPGDVLVVLEFGNKFECGLELGVLTDPHSRKTIGGNADLRP